RELLAGHEHLAAHLKRRGRRQTARSQRPGDRPVRSQVRRDVLADAAVAPRRAADEAALLIHERDAETVDFGLAYVAEVRPRQGTADPRLELADVLGRGRVVERE